MANGHTGRWINGSVMLVIAGALIVMYRDVAVSQDDIDDLEDSDAAQDEALKNLPALDAHLVSLEKVLVKLDKRLENVDKYIAADAVEDAKFHHSHRGRDGQ